MALSKRPAAMKLPILIADELRLMVYPLSVGGGLRLFDDNRELKKFRLKHSRTTGNGVLILEYQLVR
ncbi:MAG: dihydrofolate reductase family protein [Bacteroidota bacterium]